MLDGFDALIERRLSETTGAVTLVHGDFHPGQLFFPSARGGRFAVFDWQTVSAGNGGDDLARIIVSALDPDRRRLHDRRLIALYHALLVEHGVGDFDLERCHRGFQLGLVTTAIINIIAAANIDPAFLDASDQPLSMPEAMFGWVADAAEAHDVMSVLEP
jgi:aminoglycoside phosphotransferase (APT) family kinase protein